jgi:hypothetical protein
VDHGTAAFAGAHLVGDAGAASEAGFDALAFVGAHLVGDTGVASEAGFDAFRPKHPVTPIAGGCRPMAVAG